MTKEKFLSEIKNQLSFLSKEKLTEILSDYQEHFVMGQQEGRSEEEIAHSLGDPKTLAKQFKAEFTIAVAKENATAGNLARAVLSAIALGLFNVIIMLGPIAALFGIILALFAVALAFIGSGIALIIVSIPMFAGIMTATTMVGGIALGALGVALFVFALATGKLFGSLLIKYLQKNVEIIKNQ